jgi:hypothetical protein
MEDNLVWELQNNFAHTLIDLWTWVLMTHFIAVRWFWKFCDAHACENTMHMFMWYGAHDAC